MWIKDWRFQAGMACGRNPLLLRLNAWRSGHGSRIVGPQTDLCIEGFQRSGNSFFCRVVRRFNPDATIAHHLHAPVQFALAARYGTPAVLLIRPPFEVVCSLLAADARLDPDLALIEYRRFHEHAQRYRAAFIVGSFTAAVHDPGRIIHAVNTHFARDFGGHDVRPPQIQRVRENLHQASADHPHAPVPNQLKETRKNAAAPVVARSPELPAAQAIHDALLEKGVR